MIFAFLRRKALGSTNPLSSPFFHLLRLSHFSGSCSKCGFVLCHTLITLIIFASLFKCRMNHRYWSLNGWSKHPFTSSLLPYNPSWTSLAADIETEFRRIDKICLQTSPVRFGFRLPHPLLSHFIVMDFSRFPALGSFASTVICPLPLDHVSLPRKVVVTDNWVLTVGAWPWSLHIRFEILPKYVGWHISMTLGIKD